jgi:hypothetical protein
MKKQTKTQPKRSKLTMLNQLCNLIPPHLAPKLARETGVEKQWRSFSPWSHSVAMMYGQLAHCASLNDICDGLQLHSGPLSVIRGAMPPSRNNLSHANRGRSSDFAQKLFWEVFAHAHQVYPGFQGGRERGRFVRRFNRTIHLVDSSVIELVASCMSWAKHRRRKAAAKMHMNLEFQSFLPKMAIIDTAGEHDSRRARELCAHIAEGEIVVFDKAYVDFVHLGDLDRRGVFWVTRAKDNMAYQVVKKLSTKGESKILRDEIIALRKPIAGAPELMRRIVALVEVDGKEREMVFLTNHLEWGPWTIAELYRCRWDIEVFFKQIKQNLQLTDFVGQNANAVRWKIWMALLVYLLLRVQAFLSQWHHSFNRLVALLRSALWLKLESLSLLSIYGTAKGRLHFRRWQLQPYLPGF